MKKITQIGMLVIASLFISAIAFSQSNSTVADVATEVSFRPDQMSPPAPIPPKSAKGLLFENGPVVTDVGGGPGGADFSLTEAPLTLYGWGVQFGSGNRLADDFEVIGGPWSVDSIIVWAYQTNSGNTSTITGLYMQIWDGSPDDPGSSVIWGDVVTDVMDNTYWSNCYRGDDITSSARPIMRVVCAPTSLTLDDGTYWVDFSVDGSAASGPWGPPVTIPGQTDTGDGLQYTSTGWGPALNATYPNGVPFEIWGPTVAPPSDCDDFDSYTAGALLCPQSGGLWTTWDDDPGGLYDGYVVDDESLSAPNSLGLDETVIVSDLIYDLGQQTAGAWEVSLDLMVPVGATYGGYYNIMQEMDLFGATNEWGFQIYFNSDETGFMQDADFNETEFTYTKGDWIHCSVIIDLDLAQAVLTLDGAFVNEWQWDIAGPNTLGVIDIYADCDVATDVAVFYIDNVCFTEYTPPQDCDDFDSYTAGALLCPQSGGLWTTWDDDPGGLYDGYVVDDESLSAPNSLGLDETVIVSDLIYDLGQQTAGAWEVSLDLMVPVGATYGGYYNIMQEMDLFGATNEWGFQIYFNSDETGFMQDADFNETEFTYTKGDWIHCSVRIDLDLALAELWINGGLINMWQWDIAGPNTLGVIDIYADCDVATDVAMFYIDNVCFEVWVPTGIEPIAADASSVQLFPNPVSDYLSINSVEELVSIQVFSTVGQSVIATRVSGNTTRIETSGLRAGLYIVQIQTEAGFITKKFMKK